MDIDVDPLYRGSGLEGGGGGGLQPSNHASNGPRLAGPSGPGAGGRLRFLGRWMAGGGGEGRTFSGASRWSWVTHSRLRGTLMAFGLGCGRLRFFEIGEDKLGLYVGRLVEGTAGRGAWS